LLESAYLIGKDIEQESLKTTARVQPAKYVLSLGSDSEVLHQFIDIDSSAALVFNNI